MVSDLTTFNGSAETPGVRLPVGYWDIDHDRRRRLELNTPNWSLERRQKALALMYGYKSWQGLISAGRSNVRVPYDRELPEPELTRACSPRRNALPNSEIYFYRKRLI